jgi:hypothetical protein
MKWFATSMAIAMFGLLTFVIIRDGTSPPTLAIAGLGVLSGGGWALVWWRPILRDRQLRRANRCLRCEYDRRGLAAGAPCPECGLAP